MIKNSKMNLMMIILVAFLIWANNSLFVAKKCGTDMFNNCHISVQLINRDYSIDRKVSNISFVNDKNFHSKYMFINNKLYVIKEKCHNNKCKKYDIDKDKVKNDLNYHPNKLIRGYFHDEKSF